MNFTREVATYVAVVFVFGTYSIYWLAPILGLKPMAAGGRGLAELLLLAMVGLGFLVARKITEPKR
jgi:hypothetical protein